MRAGSIAQLGVFAKAFRLTPSKNSTSLTHPYDPGNKPKFRRRNALLWGTRLSNGAITLD